MSEILSDRQRIELAMPAYLLFAFSTVPGAFSPRDPALAERAEADISNLRTQLRDVSLEPFANLAPKKQNSLLRRTDRIAKGEFAFWKDEPAVFVVLKLCIFLEILIDQQCLILWEGTPMDWAIRQFLLMSKHGYDDPKLVADAHAQANQLLVRLQKEGLYLSVAIIEEGGP